jgi:hypothetical protein
MALGELGHHHKLHYLPHPFILNIGGNGEDGVHRIFAI